MLRWLTNLERIPSEYQSKKMKAVLKRRDQANKLLISL